MHLTLSEPYCHAKEHNQYEQKEVHLKTLQVIMFAALSQEALAAQRNTRAQMTSLKNSHGRGRVRTRSIENFPYGM